MLKWLLPIILIFPSLSFAHGVKGRFFLAREAIGIVAQYDDGEPMSYSKVEIRAVNATHPYQIGFTDSKGRFLFLPDKNGLWIATVRDGMGHMLKLNMSLDGNFSSRHLKNFIGSRQKFTKYEALVLGLSIIFIIFGLLFWLKGREYIKNRG